MTRRQLLLILAGPAGTASAAAYPWYVEPRWLEVTRSTVRLARIRPGRDVRILHLADVHTALPLFDEAVSLGLTERPDLVCLTGDFIGYAFAHRPREYARILKRLSTAVPTFAVLGNHDGGAWARQGGGEVDHRKVEQLLADGGVELLHNRNVQLDAGLSLVGVGDLWADEVEGRLAFDGLDVSVPVLVLAHNPDTKDLLAMRTWDLMLSGHTHGGQVVIPLSGHSFAPVDDQRYVAGLKSWGSRQIHVTRGIASFRGVRFLCRPEVSVLTLDA